MTDTVSRMDAGTSGDEKTRILHLITDLNRGGAELMLARLLMFMDRDKFDNYVVIMMSDGELIDEIKEYCSQVISLGMNRGLLDIFKAFKLFSILCRVRPDVLQTWLYHADLAGLIIGKLAGVKKIIWNIRCSDVIMSNYSMLSVLVLKLLVMLSRFPDAIISNTRTGMNHHIRLGYKPRSWEYIANGVDLKKFRPDPVARSEFEQCYGISSDAILIGNVGRYDPMKGHKVFLQAASLLAVEYKNAVFVMAGKGVNPDNPSLMQNISKYSLEDRVILLAQVSNIDSLLPALDILTSSSLYGEGFPNVIAESMACGVICVGTDVGDSAMLIGNENLIIPPGNAEAMVRAWKYVLDMDIVHRNSFRNQISKRISEGYGIRRIAEQYESFYQKIVQA